VRCDSQLTRRIDEDKAAEAREHMTRMKVIYAHSIPYRNMCRFNSGVRLLAEI
jgi:alpha 1,2-mannosyltransferase